jgi:hypothetical protein
LLSRLSEYLVAGLPVAATAGIGDTDAILMEPNHVPDPLCGIAGEAYG